MESPNCCWGNTDVLYIICIPFCVIYEIPSRISKIITITNMIDSLRLRFGTELMCVLTSSMPAQCWASGPYWRRHWWSTLYMAPGGNCGYWNSWSDGRSSRHIPQLWSRNLVISRREQLDQIMGPASELSWGDMTCCASPDAASHPLAAPSWFAPKLQ